MASMDHMDHVALFLRRHGVMGSSFLAARHLAQMVSRHIYLHERHIWYAVSSALVPVLPLAQGLALRRGSSADVERLSQSNLCSRATAYSYFSHGGELWLVHEGERFAFSCWIFRNHMPVIAARGGWQALPPKTVCLEASMTSADYRGRGIAPAAWSLIAQRLAEEGIRTIVTKVEENNTASRRAVTKAGFREMALMDYRRISGVSRTHLEVPPPKVLTDLNALVKIFNPTA